MKDAGLIEAVRVLGLIEPDEKAECVPLAGGVSSDVFLLRAEGGRELVVKRSIPKLRVSADWRAPVQRDVQEVGWLRVVKEVDPKLTPAVMGWSRKDHLFVMERISGEVWKQVLAEGHVDPVFAGQVGIALARIHRATTNRRAIASLFPDPSNFYALRIDPFLLYAAQRNPEVSGRLEALAADLQARRGTLIWGDASPKNILVGEDGPVFLDAETAAMGDPAFDVAFCLTHLLLKTIWLFQHASLLLASFEALRDAYFSVESTDEALPTRAASLVGALLLARVDGKSPAGYLNTAQNDVVRRRAIAVLAEPDLDLASLPTFWRAFA